MKKIYEALTKELTIALTENEVPVAALIVKDNKIISKAHNNKIKLNDPMAHAEILCIKKATKIIGSWNLNNCIMYTTLMPCDMCKQVIKECRIKQVFYILDSKKNVIDNTKYISFDQIKDINNYKEKITSFFKDKR